MGTQSSWQSERSTHNNGLVDQAKGAVSDVAETARETVGSQIGNQKGRLAEQIGEVAQALRDTGSRLGESEQGSFAAGYVDKAASQIERIADYVEARDVSDIIAEVQDLARREPAAFFGGLFALGLVAGRFLKSSSPRPTRSYPAQGNRDAQGSGTQSWNRGSGDANERRDYRAYTDASSVDQPNRNASSIGNTETRSSASPVSGAPAVPRPQQQAKPDVIPPAPIHEVGTATGSTGAQGAASSSTTTTPGLSPNKSEPRGGSGSGAT